MKTIELTDEQFEILNQSLMAAMAFYQKEKLPVEISEVRELRKAIRETAKSK